MAQISFSISPAPSITNDLIAVLYKTTAPGAELARILDDTNHSNPQNFQFSDLDGGNYIVVIHESPDGTTLGNIRHDWWENAMTNQILFERKFYKVGGPDAYDPAIGTTKIADPYFVGKTISGVYQEGRRHLWGEKGEWSVNSSGEIEYGIDYQGGQQIQNWENAVWIVEITYAQEATGVGNQQYEDIEVITTDTTFNSTLYNRSIFTQGSSNKLAFVVPALASIPENKGFELWHDGGNSINNIIQLQAGDVARFRGEAVNGIILAKGEGVRCVKKTIGGTPYLFSKPLAGQWDQLGELVNVRDIDANSSTLAYFDGREYDLDVYVRLGTIIDKLPSNQIITYAAYDISLVVNGETIYPNRGFFAMDFVNNTCKMPDLRNSSVRYLKAGSDPSRYDNIPGGFQMDGVGAFTGSIQGRQAAVAGGNSGNPNIVPLKSTMVPPFTGNQEVVSALAINGGSVDTHGKNHGFIAAMKM